MILLRLIAEIAVTLEIVENTSRRYILDPEKLMINKPRQQNAISFVTTPIKSKILKYEYTAIHSKYHGHTILTAKIVIYLCLRSSHITSLYIISCR